LSFWCSGIAITFVIILAYVRICLSCGTANLIAKLVGLCGLNFRMVD